MPAGGKEGTFAFALGIRQDFLSFLVLMFDSPYDSFPIGDFISECFSLSLS